MKLEFIKNLPKDEQQAEIENYFNEQDIRVIAKGNLQFKVVNGCIPAIMVYPLKCKLLFQEPDGTNYVIEAGSSETLIKYIKGELEYK